MKNVIQSILTICIIAVSSPIFAQGSRDMADLANRHIDYDIDLASGFEYVGSFFKTDLQSYCVGGFDYNDKGVVTATIMDEDKSVICRISNLEVQTGKKSQVIPCGEFDLQVEKSVVGWRNDVHRFQFVLLDKTHSSPFAIANADRRFLKAPRDQPTPRESDGNITNTHR